MNKKKRFLSYFAAISLIGVSFLMATPVGATADVEVDSLVQTSVVENEITRVFIEVDSNASESSVVIEERKNDIEEELIENDVEIREVPTPKIIAANIDAATLEELKQNPDVVSVSVREMITPALSDTVISMGASAAWSRPPGYRGSDQKIAVIDTGVDRNHPFLSGNVVQEACFATQSNRTGAPAGECPNGQPTQTGTGSAAPCTSITGCRHGTHVAGIASGNTGVSGAPTGGIAPDSTIVAVQVFGTYENKPGDAVCTNAGTTSPCILADSSDIMSATSWVATNVSDVDAVNMSLGGGTNTSTCTGGASDIFAGYVTSLKNNQKAPVVVASGNNGSSTGISWPACVSGVIAVGATSKSGSVASYSNSNALLDFFVPGSAIVSSYGASAYASLSGTSMAAPHIAGAYALMRQAYPTSSVDTLTSLLSAYGTSITDSRNGVTKIRPNIDQAILNAVTGYSFVTTNAEVLGYGGSPSYSLSSVNLPVPAVEVAAWPNRKGGWVCTRDGGIFTFGQAQGYGAGNLWIKNTVVDCMSTPSGNGYWIVTDDGGLFTFGDAQGYGAANQWVKNRVVAAFATPTGRGYTMITNDGGVFTFGDAQAYGSANQWIKNTVVEAFGTPTGRGYTIVTDDGGIFTFGDAQAYGNANTLVKNGITSSAPTPSGNGYWIVSSDGGLFTFGDAQAYGAANNRGKSIIAFF